MVGKKLIAHTTLDKGLCVCSVRWPEKTCPESFAYKGPSCGMMTAQTSMYFRQELSPFLFGDTPMENSGSAFLVQFTFMNFVGFRTPDYAMGLILIIRKLLPIKVGQERFSSWSNNSHDLMSRGCYFSIQTPDGICIVFGCWGCDQVHASFSALALPH